MNKETLIANLVDFFTSGKDGVFHMDKPLVPVLTFENGIRPVPGNFVPLISDKNKLKFRLQQLCRTLSRIAGLCDVSQYAICGKLRAFQA